MFKKILKIFILILVVPVFIYGIFSITFPNLHSKIKKNINKGICNSEVAESWWFSGLFHIDCYPYYLYDDSSQFQFDPDNPFDNPIPAKPVIYLYPEKITEVQVKIEYEPGFSVTYPEYNSGWDVTAYPSGRLVNKIDGKEYSYLFWEGNGDPSQVYDFGTGFVVKKEDTVEFLQAKLSEMGLKPSEYNEFIVYWYPKMIKNNLNLVHFATKSEYDDRAVLDIQPKPDSLLRVFMAFKGIKKPVDVIPQSFVPFEREGFTVVEWGGSELN